MIPATAARATLLAGREIVVVVQSAFAGRVVVVVYILEIILKIRAIYTILTSGRIIVLAKVGTRPHPLCRSPFERANVSARNAHARIR